VALFSRVGMPENVVNEVQTRHVTGMLCVCVCARTASLRAHAYSYPLPLPTCLFHSRNYSADSEHVWYMESAVKVERSGA
jgi:hypothetical protein